MLPAPTTTSPVAGETEPGPRVAVVVPARDACTTLPSCLRAVWRSTRRPDAVIVVDDGSSDGSGGLAREAGCEVLRIEDGPRGPAHARNAGVAASRGELVVFVDSDVEVHPDALQHLVAPLEREPRLVATFGSYDDEPAHRSCVSLYANLRHHYVHQRSSPEAETFWAGLGCVRRAAFEGSGGFDAGYTGPSIEDVELGMRLRAAGGGIRLVHVAQGKHLKRWTLRRLWVTDVRDRAIAWSRLLLESRVPTRSLNVSPAERATAALGLLAVAAAVTALVSLHALAALVAALALLGWAAANAGFFRLLHRRGGLRGAMAGAALHLAYYLYSSAAYAGAAVATAVRPRRRRGARPADAEA